MGFKSLENYFGQTLWFGGLLYSVSMVLGVPKSKTLCFYISQKKRKSHHPLLLKNQTKPNKDAYQMPGLGQASFNDFLSSHSMGIRLKHLRRSTHKSPERNELRLVFSISLPPSKMEYPACQIQGPGAGGGQLWPTHQGLVPGPFISFSEGPQGWENAMTWIFTWSA